MEEESKLKELKAGYKVLQEKHNLPEFRILNEEFNIEKAAESETEIPLREIRKCVGDKIFNYMRFIESLINPVNASMFTLSLIKLLGPEEKKKISDLYKDMMKREVAFIQLDLEFNEKKEAEFIKESFKFWQERKKDLLEVMERIDVKWNDDKIEINNVGYFG